MTDTIQLRGLSYQVQDFALRDLNLTVPKGAVYGFLGPNGAGKTTTIRLLLGLLRPQAGEIRVFGEAVPQDIVSILSRVGYVPERPHLYPSLTVAEAVRLHAAFHRRFDRPGAKDLAARFGLPMHRPLSRLSKGEMGKVMILLALAQRPELLVLDEPTVGLDPALRDQLWTMFSELAASGVTIIVSSHVMDEAERCDSLVLLREGRVLANGTLAELRERTGASDAEGAFLALVRGSGE